MLVISASLKLSKVKNLKFNKGGGLFLKFMFSKKATKIDEIFTVDLTLCSKCQIDSEYFFIFCGLLRKHELKDFLLFKFLFTFAFMMLHAKQ